MATRPTQRIIDWGAPVGGFVLTIAVWELAVRWFSIPPYLLPLPEAVAADFVSNFRLLVFHAGITLGEACLGFLLANAAGILAAIAFSHSRMLEKGLYPLAIALKTTPIVAMAPLLILWLGNGFASKVAAAALIAFFPAIVNTLRGLRSADAEALDLFRSLSANRWQTFWKLRLPAALPYIFSALKISSSLAVVGAIVGEFVGANHGIGFVILVSSYHLEMVRMFSAVVTSALTGILFFGIVSFVEKRVIFWSALDE